MSKAYLTIDDGPTKNIKKIIDFLNSKYITPIMLFYGEQINKERQAGIYAIQHGAIVGNHSYSHKHFSELSYDECIMEIEKQEEMINSLYKEAGVERKYKVMRFPFGDKGGQNKDALQEYLKRHGFSRFDDSEITYDWYTENKLNTDFDLLWTFDFTEYQMEYNNGFKYEDILKRIHNDKPEYGGALLGEDHVYNIILIHDHEKTESVCEEYFTKLINYVIDNGVEFIKPNFISKI